MRSLRSGPTAACSRPTGHSRTSTTRPIGSTRRASATPIGSRSGGSTRSDCSNSIKWRARSSHELSARHRVLRPRPDAPRQRRTRSKHMHSFVYTALPSKVLFGFGTLDKVADEVRLLDCRRALVLSTPQQEVQANDLAGRLGQLCVGTFTEGA